MKKLSYEFLQSAQEDGTDILLHKYIPYSEANEEIAKREAYNGYTIEDDGVEEIVTPTQLDRIESQVAYLAMMTGNEDILEV